MKIFELFNEAPIPPGEIQGELLSGMMDAGSFSHVLWKQADKVVSEIPYTPLPTVPSNEVIVASSSWSSKDSIFGVIKFIQTNAHKKHSVSGPFKKASAFYWTGIVFVVVKVKEGTGYRYDIFAAPDTISDQSKDEGIEEQSPKANAYALTGSGLGGDIRKPGKDTKYLKSVRTPGTTYSKTSKKQDWPAKKHGAVDGFVG